MILVEISPPVRLVVEGSMDQEEFTLLRAWIERNREALALHWEGEIDTLDFVERVR